MINSLDARSGVALAEVATETSPEELEERCQGAAEAFLGLEAMGRAGRAAMLSAMADALEARRAEVVTLADRETALGEARLNGELTRTTYQLRFFAGVVQEGAFLEATVDHPRETAMGPQPDLRRILAPLGPVGVFGASNFPLAFSVPGGDTASALAAGCPVVVKVHNAHPATSVVCGEALAEGASRAGAPAAAVSLVFGERAGAALVEHPLVKAVGFTGSLAGGRHLFDLAARRPSPIPFYGELGALNAVVVGPGAAATRSAEIGAGLATSFTLGVGQFCTKPGLVLLPQGPDGDAVLSALAAKVGEGSPGAMLTERIAAAFSAGATELQQLNGVRLVARGATGGPGGAGGPGGGAAGPGSAGGPAWPGTAVVLEAAPELLGRPDSPLLRECFGPVIVAVRYRDGEQLLSLVGHVPPALTATVQADEADHCWLGPVLASLQQKAGRVVWNGYPTGVAVTWAMHHGGPYPATTNPLHTSVGAAAIRRWLQPVCFQNVPQALLPPELRDDPGPDSAVPRRVDGQLVLPGAPG